jgi:pSer/pThr/pTyr-binding forkhead associated (FHA) protein
MEHDSISRKHCQFVLNSDGALVVKDLESMNGTYVDDSRVQHATLMPGQLIQIGALRLKIDFSDDEELTSPPLKKPQGNVHATQPMNSFRPVPLPPEKTWWQKLLGR